MTFLLIPDQDLLIAFPDGSRVRFQAGISQARDIDGARAASISMRNIAICFLQLEPRSNKFFATDDDVHKTIPFLSRLPLLEQVTLQSSEDSDTGQAWTNRLFGHTDDHHWQLVYAMKSPMQERLGKLYGVAEFIQRANALSDVSFLV